MENKKSSKKGNLIGKKMNTRLVIAAAAILMIVCQVLPYASYTYKKTTYTLSGIQFLTGASVSNGKVVIGMSATVLIALITTVLILVVQLAEKKLSGNKADAVRTVLALICVAADIGFAGTVASTLKGAKDPGIAYGNIIHLVLAVALLVHGMYVLWKNKVISTLDFMVIPGMLYFIINNYIPMLGIVIAFKKIDYSVGIVASPWVGFDNFKMLFAHSGSFFESDAFIITRNTLLYNIAFIVLGTIMGIVVGICLADITNKALQKFFQTSILLPQLISMVIVAYIVYALLSNETGMINNMLGEGNEINFYSQQKYWPFILIFVQVWKQIGYNGIIFLSSIVGIDQSIYEAAKVDGASKLRQIRYITMPLLKPTIITLGLLQVGRIFYSDFGLFYQVPLDSGALYNVTNTIDTYVYRCLMVLNNISTASAASTYQAVVGFVLVFSVNMLVRKKDKDNALF